MKVLLAGDLHYHLRKLDWVTAAAEHVDLVILAGDHLEFSSHVNRTAQASVIQRYLQRIKARANLIVSSGNHDLDAKDESGERITKWIKKLRFMSIPTDGESVVYDDILFSIFPWTDGQNAEQRVQEQLLKDAEQRTGKWIWIHHEPPADSPVAWDGRRHFGANSLRSWIEQYNPDIVISGHVHQSPFVPDGSWVDKIGDTWAFNAGHQMGPLPPHIIFDTNSPTVFWKSMPMLETIDMTDSEVRRSPPATPPPEWVFAMDQAEAPQLE